MAKMISIDYNKILEVRKNDGRENFEYFIQELLAINEVKSSIVKNLGQINNN